MENYIIKLIPVKDLVGKRFIIPAYQRGYKWTEQQVKDLLNDIWDFTFNSSRKDGFLCLQPLAVAKTGGFEETIKIEESSDEEIILSKVREAFNKNVQWAVIDGQQRLTTIKLIMKYLNSKTHPNETLYDLKYETREDSAGFLANIVSKEENDATNSDYYHMRKVYSAIELFFRGKSPDELDKIKNTILEKTQFIWYECPKKDEIRVFTDLNKGKIKLTNAELIKALFLTASNFTDPHRQHEIANEWDEIERSLQNDEFWLFFHDNNYSNPTRIDYLFDVLCNLYVNKIKRKKQYIISAIGTDEYRTFRFYENLIVKKKNILNNEDEKDLINKLWGDVKELYYTLMEWYNDLYFYHDIGFLVECAHMTVGELYKSWKENDKGKFRYKLTEKIEDSINAKDKCEKGKTILDIQYKSDEGDSNKPDKTKCKPILLLHNVQTVINQNKRKRGEDQYKYEVFYKFPFYLFKRNKWDVEHIDSTTTNGLDKNITRLTWLLQFKDYKSAEEKIKEIINTITKNVDFQKEKFTEEEIINSLENANIFDKFDELQSNIFDNQKGNQQNQKGKQLAEGDERNQIWNFTLLDASTNRGYGNSLFPSKRRTIMAKERRQSISLILKKQENEWRFDFEQVHDENVTTFIPPVTRNVFMKYYTPEAQSFECWSKDDATKYKEDIEETLKLFIKKEVDKNE